MCFPCYHQWHSCDLFLKQLQQLSDPTLNSFREVTPYKAGGWQPLPLGSEQHTRRQGARPPVSAVASHWIATSSKASAVPTETSGTLESQQNLSHHFNCLRSWKQLCHHHRCLIFQGKEHTWEQRCWRSAAWGSWGRTGSCAIRSWLAA